MFRDKSTGKIKWRNVVLTKLGILFPLYMMHVGADNHVWVRNIESTIMHGPRKTAPGFYEGDAEIRVIYNKDGHKEPYFVYLPSEEMYALGRDGLAKEPRLLVGGLENRVIEMNQSQAGEIYNAVEMIRKQVYERSMTPDNPDYKEKKSWWHFWK